MPLEAHEAAEHVHEAHHQSMHPAHTEADTFRSRAAIGISLIAVVLAISSLGGENATKEMIQANIEASDLWAFYQAKSIRQTSNQLAADELEATLALVGANAPAEARQHVETKIAAYRATAVRYESEPDPHEPDNALRGEGKRQLRAQAEHLTHERNLHQVRDRNFDFAVVFLQIAIVLGSVAIVANSKRVLYIALSLGAVGAVLMLNGFLLVVKLPFLHPG